MHETQLPRPVIHDLIRRGRSRLVSCASVYQYLSPDQYLWRNLFTWLQRRARAEMVARLDGDCRESRFTPYSDTGCLLSQPPVWWKTKVLALELEAPPRIKKRVRLKQLSMGSPHIGR